MTLVYEVWDERGDKLEAHCDQVSGDGYRWHVELFSDKGLRGMFTLNIPATITMEKAINDRIQEDGIHARN